MIVVTGQSGFLPEIDKKGLEMKKISSVIIMAVLIFSATILPAHAAGEALKIVMDDNYPPFAFRNDQGELVGISVDMWRLFEEKTGREVEIDGMDWGLAQETMQRGEYDVIDTMFKSDTRTKLYDFTMPYANIETSLYFHKNISGINDIESAKAFTVATKRGGYSVEVMKEKGLDNILQYESYEDIVEAAGRGQVAMFLMDDIPARYFLYKNDIQEEFRHTEPIYSNQFYRAIKKGDTKLLTFINFGFNLVEDSELDEIYEKWEGKSTGISEKTKALIFIFSMGLLLLLFLSFGASLYSRKQVRQKTKKLEAVLADKKELAERLEAVIDAIPDMMFVINSEGIFVENMIEIEKAKVFTGMEFGEKSLQEVFPPGLAKLYRSKLEEFIEKGRSINFEGEINETDLRTSMNFECNLEEMGHDLQYEIRLSWINEELILVVTRDITELNLSKKKLYELGIKDSLTGIHNRNYFERELDKMEKGKGDFAVLVCDVDALKLYNDILGHVSGDEYLKLVSEILKTNLPEGAVLSRIGGDEFSIILPDATLSQLEELKQKIKDDLKDKNVKYAFVPTSLSIGYALRHVDGESMRQLYKFADDEMYREKTNHRYTRNKGDISLLTNMLEARSFETEAHAKRLENYCVEIGKSLGFRESTINSLAFLAKFHDIGKIGIRDKILLKPGALTASEFEEMKKHSEIGYRIAKSMPDLEHVADLIHKHHEWFDGSGYPFGLKGQEIPKECRILSVVDAYDAMTSDRPYREAIGKEKAIKELKLCSGSQFDPDIVDLFTELLQREETL